MNIKEKLAYIQKAIEMGAEIEVKFHDICLKEDAKKAAVELGKFGGLKHKHKSHKGTNWYKLRTDDYSLETTIFFNGEDTKKNIFDDEKEVTA